MAEEGWRSQSNFVITSRKLTRYSSGFAWTPSSRVPAVPPRVDSVWYIAGSANTGNYLTVPQWAAGVARAAGVFVRQDVGFVPAFGADRCFVALNSGTTGGTRPVWDTTRGGKTLDNNITWQECTGVAGPCGDVVNTVNWTVVQNTSVSLGQVIKNVAVTHYFICSTQGTAGNGAEPSWNTTTGGTTTDGTLTWHCIGAISTFNVPFKYPHNTVAGANSAGWGQDGNTFYIANNHLEILSTAGVTYSIAGGTVTSPRYYVCTDKLAAPPQSANVSQTITTGNNAIFVTGIGNILQIASGAGDCQYWEGVWFNSSNSSVTSKLQFGLGSGSMLTLRNCLLWQQGGPIQLGSNVVSASGQGSSLQILSTQPFNNNMFQGSGTTGIEIQGGQVYINGGNGGSNGITGTFTGTSIFTANTTNGSAAKVLVQGCTIVPASSKTLVNATNMQADFTFLDCNFQSISGILTGTPLALNGTRIDIINCDSGNTNYRNERYVYAGTGTTELTIIRTGGATDGVTPASRKIVTGSGASWAMPYEDNMLSYWNDVIAAPAAKYITLYGVWNGGAVPNNDDIWIEVDYLSASSTKSQRITTTKANILATGTATDVDSSTWGGGTTPFSISTALFTQVKAGYIYVTVKVGRPSTTIYYDPKIALI